MSKCFFRYFGIIVPSPDDGVNRDQKKNLSISFKESQTTPIVRSAKMRDGWCQTDLTLPPILPIEVENALRPHFTYTQSQQQTPSKVIICDSSVNANKTIHNESIIDHDARDASLRRKLFQTIANTSEYSTEYERDVHLDSPPPQTPEMVNIHITNIFIYILYAFNFILIIVLEFAKKDLKNIRNRRFLTPNNHQGKMQDENKSPLSISLSPVKRESFGCLSPISKVALATPESNRKNLLSTRKIDTTSTSSLFRSTPDRSSICCWKFADMSVDAVYSTKRKSFHLSDDKSFDTNETTNDGNFSLDDEMQSSYGSQQHPQTPTLNKSKRRCSSVNRKNLSRSFNQIDQELSQSQHHHHHSEVSSDRTDSLDRTDTLDRTNVLERTDSGINDMYLGNFDDLQLKKRLETNGHLFRNAESPTFFNLSKNDCDVSMASMN